jgi:UDP-glucose 4-epimerase
MIKMKKILVIGGAGFVGSHLVEELVKIKKNKVYVVDNLFLGTKKNLIKVKERIYFFNFDASNQRKMNFFFKNKIFDIVFNLATKPINYSLINPLDGFYAQIDIVLNLLELCREKKIKKLIHFSTSEVYGTGSGTMSEDYKCIPETTYAAGKFACDTLIKTYTNLYNLDTVIIRPSNIYGPRQYNKNKHSLSPGLIVAAINSFKYNKSFQINGNGLQSRDYIYVKDFVKLLVKSFKKLKKNNVYHFSSNQNIKIVDIVKIIKNKLKYKKKISFSKKRQGDVYYHKLNNKKLKTIIDFKLTSFSNGIDETIKYY